MNITIAMYGSTLKTEMPDSVFARACERMPDVRFYRMFSAEELFQRGPETDVLWMWHYPVEFLSKAPKLRWMHSNSVGVRDILTPEWRRSGIPLTNGRGLFTIPMAEFTIGAMLALSLRFPETIRAQDRREWCQDAIALGGWSTMELYGKTLGIIGYGGVGREVARRAKTFGMRIITADENPGDDPLLDCCYRAGEYRAVVREADFLSLSVPLTAATESMIGARELAMMKSSAVLINTARGALIDEAAVQDALRTGRIRAAAIDAFRDEPLPPDSPWWTTPNVLINPHNCGMSDRFWDRIIDLFADNLQRFQAGKELKNVVPPDRGY